MKQKAGCAPHCDFLFVNMTKLVVGFQGRSNASTGARDHTQSPFLKAQPERAAAWGVMFRGRRIGAAVRCSRSSAHGDQLISAKSRGTARFLSDLNI